MPPECRQHKFLYQLSHVWLPLLIMFHLLNKVPALNTTGTLYPFGYFNISENQNDVGFIQIFVCGTQSSAEINLELQSTQFNYHGFVGQSLSPTSLNDTIAYNRIDLTDASTAGVDTLPYGLMVRSDLEISVYAVKADKGTTDGYLVFPLTNYSTEFIVAGWIVPPTNTQFFSGVVISSAYDDTCVEIYTVDSAGIYRRQYNIYLQTRLMISQYLVNNNVDTTGYFINSTKPISVTSGVTCGNVPTNVLFCDHMAEQIPPIGELGTVHIVPPILGRAPSGGYIVRVVGVYPNTVVTWSPTFGVIASSTSPLSRGQYIQLNVGNAAKPLMVTCSLPCVVMQYNKGFRTVATETTPTDPFIMLTISVEHFASAACFLTASMSSTGLNGEPMDFANYLSVVALTSAIGSVQIDGQQLQSSLSLSSTQSVGSYTVITGGISHGSHTLSVIPGSAAVFAAYLYGHSTLASQRSGYGYPVAYKMLGQLVGDWNVLPIVGQSPLDSNVTVVTETSTGVPSTSTCQQEFVLSGSAVANYQLATVRSATVLDSTVLYPVQLETSLQSPVTSLSDKCTAAYTSALRSLMNDVFRNINSRLCQCLLCPYLQNQTTGGIATTTSRLFVGINATSPNYTISFDAGSTLRLQVPYVGTIDTTVDAFARCRGDIRRELTPFLTWIQQGSSSTLTADQQQLLAKNQLLTPPLGCPALTFGVSNFTTSNPTCSI